MSAPLQSPWVPSCIPPDDVSHLTRAYMNRSVRVESMVSAWAISFPRNFRAAVELLTAARRARTRARNSAGPATSRRLPTSPIARVPRHSFNSLMAPKARLRRDGVRAPDRLKPLSPTLSQRERESGSTRFDRTCSKAAAASGAEFRGDRRRRPRRSARRGWPARAECRCRCCGNRACGPPARRGTARR